MPKTDSAPMPSAIVAIVENGAIQRILRISDVTMKNASGNMTMYVRSGADVSVFVVGVGGSVGSGGRCVVILGFSVVVFGSIVVVLGAMVVLPNHSISD